MLKEVEIKNIRDKTMEFESKLMDIIKANLRQKVIQMKKYLFLLTLIILILSLSMNGCKENSVTVQPVHSIPRDEYADCSPTGEWIAYQHFAVDIHNDTSGIYLIHPDGTGKHLIIPNGKDPSWSPDGEKIAFTGYDGQIWIFNLENKIYHRLTTEGLNIESAWSNKGDKIVYRSNEELVISDTNGTTLIKTNLGGSYPSWSPFDDSLCYNSNAELTILDISTQKTVELFAINSPDWDANSNEIVYDFYNYDKKESAIWIYNLQNKNNRKLIDGGYFPAWSADGKEIVYSSNLGDKTVLFITNIDGTNNKQITD